MSFSKQVAGFAKDAMQRANRVYRGSVLELFSVIVEATPVGQPSEWKHKPPRGYTGGRLRGNWQASLNTQKTGELERKGGGGPQTEINSVVSSLDLDEKAIMANNLPYAVAIENGHSKQSHKGAMVKENVREWNRLVARNAKRVKK